MIKNFIPRLAERGRVKIGEKGEMQTSQGGKQFAQPKKLDHMVITTMARDAAGRLLPDTELMARLHPGGGKITEIPVRLLYDDPDLNFFTRYACYRGTRCWCSGDGETAQRLSGENGNYKPVPCPCELQDPMYQGKEKCKTLGTLQVLIEGVNRVGGVWSFRTTSWNSVNAILSSMALIKTISGGPLAGIPLVMVLSPKTVTIPTTGQSMVVFIVSLEFRGAESELADLGYEIARRRIENRVRMETVEVHARKLLAAPHQESAQEQEDTAAEFFPDGMASPEPDGEVQEAELIQAPTPDPERQVAAVTQGQGHKNREEQEPTSPAITLPALMELAKKPDGIADLPVDLVTTKGVRIGRWLDWGPSLGGEMQVVLELVDNLAEVAQGLTVPVIEKAFNEAGIILKVVTAADAVQEGKERLEPPDVAKYATSETPPLPPPGGRSTAAAPKGNGGNKTAVKALF
jgi:hypothetical protein